jgi:hypothetical protein
VLIETRDLFFAIESIPGVAVTALTNVPALETFASSICGVRLDDESKPHLLARDDNELVVVPRVNTAAALLEAFLVRAGDVFTARASFNPLPDA